MGSDTEKLQKVTKKDISIHAARVGSDGSAAGAIAGGILFQSTLPEWAATVGGDVYCKDCYISIHAARVGSDRVCIDMSTCVVNFNPRCPSGQRLTVPGRAYLPGLYFNPRCPSGQRQPFAVRL